MATSSATLSVTVSSFGSVVSSQKSRSSLQVSSSFKPCNTLFCKNPIIGTSRQGLRGVRAEVKGDSATDQAKRTADEVTQQFENVAKKGQDLVSESAGNVEEAVEGAGDFVRNTGIDIKTNADNTAAKGEEAAKNVTGEVKDKVGGTASKMGDEVQEAAGNVQNKVGSTAQDLQGQAQEDKEVAQDLKDEVPDILKAKSREFVNHDAARDDDNQEQNPGADMVPKDGIV